MTAEDLFNRWAAERPLPDRYVFVPQAVVRAWIREKITEAKQLLTSEELEKLRILWVQDGGTWPDDHLQTR